MKRSHLFFLLLALCMGREARADRVKGTVIDATTGEPLQDVQLSSIDQVPGGYLYWTKAQTDSLGRFNLKGYGQGTLHVECPGYEAEKRRFLADADGNDTIDLGTIALQPAAVMLKEAKVVARARRFVMRGDTVVFNPRAFELAEGARLEELIKKLPGVSQKEGRLYWNDKPLRLLMNGEELFDNAGQLTAQLPAEAVDKIKTYNKASDLARRTGRDDGGEDQVLDLQIKPGWLDKWYGDAAAAMQTPDKAKGELTAYRLSTHDPVMLYGNANNLGDVTLQRSFGTYSNSSGDFARQQFGSFGYKHQLNKKQGTKTLERWVTASGSFGHTDYWSDEESTFETYFPGAERTFRLTGSHDYRHSLSPRFDFSMKYERDTLWTFYLNGWAGYWRDETQHNERSAVFALDPFSLSRHPLDDVFATRDDRATAADSLAAATVASTCSNPFSKNDVGEVNLSGSATRYLRGKGALTLIGRASYRDERTQTFRKNDYRYYREENLSRADAQYDHTPSHRWRSSWRLNYEQWLGKHVLFKPSYQFDYHREFGRRDIYYADAGYTRADFLSLPADSLLRLRDARNSLRRRYSRTINSLALNWTMKWGKVNLSPGISLGHRHEKSDYRQGNVDTSAVRNETLLSPEFNLRWKPAKGTQFALNGSLATTLPELEQTIGYRDDSDPLNIREGNPHLRRGYTYRAGLAYYGNFTRNVHAFSSRLNYTKSVRPVQTLYAYNPASGIYRMRPENVRGGYQVGLNANDEFTLRERYTLGNELNITLARNYVFLTANEGEAHRLNKQNAVELEYTPRFTYETKRLATGVNGHLVYHHDDNSQTVSLGSSYWQARASGFVRLKLGRWEFFTELTDQYHHGYPLPEMNRHRWVLGAWATLKCFEGKGLLRLKFDDLFNQERNLYGYQEAYQRLAAYHSLPHHYARLSFQYHFDAKANKKK